jgi:hypothetical protein
MHNTVAPTPEAVRHLNLDVVNKTNGEIISVRSRNRVVMDIMVEDGYLDDHHPQYAEVFMALRMAWLAPVAFKASSLCDAVSSFFDATPVKAAEVYDAICRLLEKRTTPVIVWTATTPADSDSTFINAISGGVCNRAFLDLEKAMDAVNADTKKRLRGNS